MLDKPEIEIENRDNPNAKSPLEFDILDQTGHIKQIWDKDVDDEIEMARKVFDKMLKKGYNAYKVKKDGSQGEKIKVFDPTAEKMILAPALQGG